MSHRGRENTWPTCWAPAPGASKPPEGTGYNRYTTRTHNTTYKGVMMSEFIIKLPVRWGDMDAFNHVSNVVYLRYIEDCRGQWMQSVPSHWQEADTGPVVANININYRRPLYRSEEHTSELQSRGQLVCRRL